MMFDEDDIEKLAQALYEVFCNGLRSNVKTCGAGTGKVDKARNALSPYTELSQDDKEFNRSNVRDIPNKLASIGYTILAAQSNDTVSKFSNYEIESLAKMEHARWMYEKLDSGWKYGKSRNSKRKLHPCIVPWDELPENEKSKDRILVRSIPAILAGAGYTIVKLDKECSGR